MSDPAVAIARRLVIVAALAGMSACGNQEATHAAAVHQVRQEAERKVQEVERLRLETEKARIEAEKARQAAEKSKSNWQMVASVLGVLLIGAFVFGVGLGSSARKDSDARKSSTG
jgi:ferric-dicitrate binding protein FerR (iron transport regulator)